MTGGDEEFVSDVVVVIVVEDACTPGECSVVVEWTRDCEVGCGEVEDTAGTTDVKT